MPGLFDRLLLTASQRSIATWPAPAESGSAAAGDSFILDWSLDGTDASDQADDDIAIELASSAK
jgi:hypothetical protein